MTTRTGATVLHAAGRRPQRAARRGAAAAVVVVLLGLGACTPEAERIADGRDPLASLSVAAPSHVYDLAFWVREERAKSRLWRAAAEYCRRRAEDAFPNCRNIRMAAWWEAPPELPRLPEPGIARPGGTGAPPGTAGQARPAAGGGGGGGGAARGGEGGER